MSKSTGPKMIEIVKDGKEAKCPAESLRVLEKQGWKRKEESDEVKAEKGDDEWLLDSTPSAIIDLTDDDTGSDEKDTYTEEQA